MVGQEQFGMGIDSSGASIEITHEHLVIRLDDRTWTDTDIRTKGTALAILFQRFPTGDALRAMVDAMLTKLGR